MAEANAKLKKLLKAAQDADPGDRMDFRDDIAVHGAAAVDALRPWLADPAMRAFAIRTIAKAGAMGARDEAVAALRTVPADSPPYILRDVDQALSTLGARRQAEVRSVGGGGPLPAGDELNEELYAYLIDAARNGRYVTYSEAGEIVGLTMRNPHHRRLIGQVLGQISMHEDGLGRPMLSSIVVNKDQKSKLGQGFYQLGEELGRKSIAADPDAFAANEAAKTFDYWRSVAGHGGGASSTGAPDYRSRAPGEDPPPALGGCDFSGDSGRCLNPGRWDRDGHLSCTTHARASAPAVWQP